MAFGQRYIGVDPGAVGPGNQWFDTTTGDIFERNLSNTAWVLAGNIAQPNLGHVSRYGDILEGPLSGVTGFAPVVSPDFQVSAKLDGLDLSTQQFVNAEIAKLSALINSKIQEAIVNTVLVSNVNNSMAIGVGNLSTVVGEGWRKTLPLPVYADGSTADIANCKAIVGVSPLAIVDGTTNAHDATLHFTDMGNLQYEAYYLPVAWTPVGCLLTYMVIATR